MITRLASPHDARRQQVQLTPQGRTTFERLDEGSKHEVAALLEALPDPEGAIAAMDALRRAIEDDRTVTIRDRQPGDLGWLVERHGVLYTREYGWDESFERLVAKIAAEFDPATDRAWIAEINQQRAGAVLCVHDTPQSAKLRTLLVEPHARGLGIGKAARRRGHPPRHRPRLHDADPVDQRHPPRRSPHLRAGRLHAQDQGAPPRVRPRPDRADLVAYPPPMDRDALRALQAPLKDQYKDGPEQALITLKATGTLGEGVSCSVDTGRAIANAGLHPATGGDGTLLCSGDMLLEALVACAGVTLGAVSTSLGIPINEGRVHAEGDLDFRGTLGVDKEAPVGFSDIRLSFELDTDADDEQLATLLKLTERYCVVLQTLARGPQLDVKLERATTTA